MNRLTCTCKGKPRNVDDLPELAGTLHAALGWSPVAHGSINAIDLAGLRAQPGIVAVLTAADIPGLNDCGAIVHDEPILADGEVQYLGQPIFVVLSCHRDTARRVAARASEFVSLTPCRPC